MKKAYGDSKEIQIHYRYAGKGAPIVLLHPSPRSSKTLEPLGDSLATDFQIIAPDLPNYGESDTLPFQVQTLYDYVPYLKAFFEGLGLQKFSLYGSATGAQLAIAYALTHPQDIQHLYLDNVAHFTEEQYQSIVPQYFPEFSPQIDGTHLVRLWQHLKDSFLFFPWFDYQHGKRLHTGIPPAEIVNQMCIDYLKAGKNWDSAYRAAFLHERAEKVKALTVPTTLFRWKASILLEYIDQLIAQGLPAHIHVLDTPESILVRYEAMKSAMMKNQV